TVGTIVYEYNDTVPATVVISQNPAAGTTVAVGSSVDLVVSLGQPQAPDVVGETEPNATAAITAVDNLTVGTIVYEYNDTVPATVVISQNPAAGTLVPIGSSVDLVVSLGQPQVPDVVGETEPNATTAITAVDNLTVGTVSYDYNDSVPQGLVISQNPAAGTLVPIGSSVDLVVSLGQPQVPDVVGDTEPNATAAITAVDNLTVGTVTYEYSDIVAVELVIVQNPLGGTTVAVGSSVDLVVSLGQPNVPDVVGMTQSAAYSAITAVDNLTVGTVTQEHSDTMAAGLVVSQDPAAGTTVPLGSSVDLVISLGQPKVPNVVDMNEADANAAITAVDNLTVGTIAYEYNDTVPATVVISQDPAAGTTVAVGSFVDLVVSLGQPQVPDVVGETEPNATAAITAVDNLTVGTIVYEYNDTIAATVVISQNPAAGTLVPIGSSVDLVVSLGQPQVPDVVGETEPNAATAITAVDNLTVGTVTYDYNDAIPQGLVISQTPSAGTLVPIGSSIDLVVSLGQPQVPDVVGETEPNATAAITAVDNLTVGTIIYEYNDTVAATVVISQNPAAGTTVAVGASVDLVVSLGQPQVPDVVGETEPNATAAITAVDNLTVGTIVYEYNDVVADGNVISQNPAAGTLVPIGSSVDLVVSLGKPQVPDVVGATEPNATAAITAVDNLTVGAITYDYNDTVAQGLVTSQIPSAGTLVPIGASVDLVVSLGQPQVPDVVGETEPNATAAITAVDNLTVGTIVYEYNDTIAATVVISQNPAAGTTVPIGSS
ncbi:MAG: PASTA domain-containing protein, partial [Planctomycetota bacterium]